MPSLLRTGLVRWLPQIVLIAEVALVVAMLRNWAYVTTYRLYVNQRVDDSSHSTAAQRFEIEGSKVVPQIAMRDDDRIAFSVAIGQSSLLRLGLRPAGRTSYEIYRRGGSTDQLLGRGDAFEPVTLAYPLPPGAGRIELVSHGAVTWVDPRVVRDLRLAPHAGLLMPLLVGSIVWVRRRPQLACTRDRGAPLRLFKAIALVGSLGVSLAALEVGLRVMADRLPAGIAAERHDLGEVREDPRWEESPRYGRRFRQGVDTVNEWRDGDIVRMGFIPPEVADHTLHRFAFHTDDEGFRNARTRRTIDVAALGDSFTDAMTLSIDDAWTSQLERSSGLAVQNYGTAGFGPQQELRVLKDYAARHRPRIVVLAYFAGNDLFDAEAFDEFDRSAGAIRRPPPGWRIKDVVSRADTWFVVSALRAASTWVSKHPTAVTLTAAERATTSPPDATTIAPTFNRGMFSVPVNGRVLRWAFMPPYLNTLRFSENDLAARAGWALTRRAIGEMHQVSREIGATFVVMFLPFKSQIYLPLLDRQLSRRELAEALQFYLGETTLPDVDAMFRNRLAQNALMHRLCEDMNIPFLDTTDALDRRVESGENVYFPDESHLNEAGHSIVAAALRVFLEEIREKEVSSAVMPQEAAVAGSGVIR